MPMFSNESLSSSLVILASPFLSNIWKMRWSWSRSMREERGVDGGGSDGEVVVVVFISQWWFWWHSIRVLEFSNIFDEVVDSIVFKNPRISFSHAPPPSPVGTFVIHNGHQVVQFSIHYSQIERLLGTGQERQERVQGGALSTPWAVWNTAPAKDDVLGRWNAHPKERPSIVGKEGKSAGEEDKNGWIMEEKLRKTMAYTPSEMLGGKQITQRSKGVEANQPN
ncbi:hypothetical protein LXL04_019891 [Taraxacum kok-saghyz]